MKPTEQLGLKMKIKEDVVRSLTQEQISILDEQFPSLWSVVGSSINTFFEATQTNSYHKYSKTP